MDTNDYLASRISPLNYQTGTFANLCQHDGCDVETLGDADLCPWHITEAEMIADADAADRLAARETAPALVPAFRAIRMTAKGGFARGWGGQEWKVRR